MSAKCRYEGGPIGTEWGMWGKGLEIKINNNNCPHAG